MRETDLQLLEGDISDLTVDVIVNAANEKLQLGSGAAGAIPKKGGPTIPEDGNRISGTAVGTAVRTAAANLKAKHVIHAVGPKKGEGEEDKKLASSVRASLALAERQGMRSIALPAISAGEFR